MHQHGNHIHNVQFYCGTDTGCLNGFGSLEYSSGLKQECRTLQQERLTALFIFLFYHLTKF